LQRYDSKAPQYCAISALCDCNVRQSQYCDVTASDKTAPGKFMKKSREASELAARLAAAASQPAGMSSVTTPPQTAPEPPARQAATTAVTKPAKPKKEKAKEPQTVPITLRPDSALLNKFVLKASERTRQEGRVVSAQQIMLEALERSDA
jgi:hypothetical protein